MSIDAHHRCSRAIRSLRFNWIQNPEVILNEKLQTVGLNSDYLKNDSELFEVFRRKLYRRLNKRYYGYGLNKSKTILWIKQTILWIYIRLYSSCTFRLAKKIMWKKLKCKPRNEQTYEQIRKIITMVQPRKRSIFEKVSEKLVVDTRFKQLKDNDFVYKCVRNLTPLEQEKKTLKTLGVLQSTRFTWKKSPIKVLGEKLQDVGLQLDVFKEESILFSKHKDRLGRKFQVSELHKYRTFIELTNQDDFQWQLDPIWEVLFNKRSGEECYELLETLQHVK